MKKKRELLETKGNHKTHAWIKKNGSKFIKNQVLVNQDFNEEKEKEGIKKIIIIMIIIIIMMMMTNK